MSHNIDEYIRGAFGRIKVSATPEQEKNKDDIHHATGHNLSDKPGLKSMQLENDSVISVKFYLFVDPLVTFFNQTDNNKTIRFIRCDTPKADSRSVMGPKYPTAKYADRDNNQTYILYDKIEKLLHIQLDSRLDTDIPTVFLKKDDDPAKQLELKRHGLLFFTDERLSDGDYELIIEIQRTKGKKTLEEIYEKKDLRRETPPSGLRYKR